MEFLSPRHLRSIGIAALALSLLGAGCGNPKDQPNNPNQYGDQGKQNTSTSSVDLNEKLVLQNLGGITFAKWQPGSATAGDLRFSKYYVDIKSGHSVPVFLFGQPLPKDVPMPNPNFEFAGLDKPITLVSAIDGIVAFIQEQPQTKDNEVFLQTKDKSIWVIGYDHVTDLQVTKGQRIKVGDIIGKAAVQNNGVYRYELQINKEVNGVTTYYCPTDLLSADTKATTVAAMEQMVKDWNTFMGQNVYGQYTSSCTKPVLTSAEVGN
jgi:hypothetical protein